MESAQEKEIEPGIMNLTFVRNIELSIERMNCNPENCRG